MQIAPRFRRLRRTITTTFATFAFVAAGATLAGQGRSEFGSREGSGASLIGILYDLKQDQARKPLPISHARYGKLVDEFISTGWDEAVLNRFFRAARPLYTTEIFIPLIPAKNAPKAFEVENIVKPQYWLIHYKGQVSAPSTGAWRFWGYGEEVCNVAINGKNVLVSNWREITTPSANWKSPEAPGQPVASGHLKAGDWIELKEGEVVDMDVLIGERGGGVFCAFLLIEKRGERYEMLNGKPVLPVFRLAPHDTPQPKSKKEGPVIARGGPIWKGVE